MKQTKMWLEIGVVIALACLTLSASVVGQVTNGQ